MLTLTETLLNPKVDSPPFAATVVAAAALVRRVDLVHQPLGLSKTMIMQDITVIFLITGTVCIIMRAHDCNHALYQVIHNGDGVQLNNRTPGIV